MTGEGEKKKKLATLFLPQLDAREAGAVPPLPPASLAGAEAQATWRTISLLPCLTAR